MKQKGSEAGNVKKYWGGDREASLETEDENRGSKQWDICERRGRKL